jgi:hypothetical protein
MRDESYMLFTREGENLARTLVAGICAKVEADLLTRRRALDHASDAMEKIAAIDAGISDSEAVGAIAARLSISFARAGYLSVDGRELQKHAENWQIDGAAVGSEDPIAVQIAQAASDFEKAAGALASRSDIRLAVSPDSPFDGAGFGQGADIAVYSARGDVSGNPYVGAMVIGPDGCQFIDRFANHPDAGAVLKEVVLKRDGIDYAQVGPEVERLGTAALNLARMSNAVNQPGRLGMALGAQEDGSPRISISWDGRPVMKPSQPRNTEASAVQAVGQEDFMSWIPEAEAVEDTTSEVEEAFAPGM